jgi:hypothetical protein
MLLLEDIGALNITGGVLKYQDIYKYLPLIPFKVSVSKLDLENRKVQPVFKASITFGMLQGLINLLGIMNYHPRRLYIAIKPGAEETAILYCQK